MAFSTETTAALMVPMIRGSYNELIDQGVSTCGHSVASIIAKFAPALPGTFVEFDSKGRGDSVNHDLYGYDLDRGLAVVQVRHAFKRAARHYLNARKSYFLVGFTDTGAPFRHPVSAQTVQKASRKSGDPSEVVRAAEKWIFGLTAKQYEAGVRQGDVFMHPSRRRPPQSARQVGSSLSVLGSHEIRATEIAQDENGKIYAYDPAVYHLKGQHQPVYATTIDQWWVIKPGREARTYDFAERLGD